MRSLEFSTTTLYLSLHSERDLIILSGEKKKSMKLVRNLSAFRARFWYGVLMTMKRCPSDARTIDAPILISHPAGDVGVNAFEPATMKM